MGKLFNMDNPLMKRLAILLDFFLLNGLFVITSLPLITIFGNGISLYYVYRKYLEGEPKSLISTYLKQVKINFIVGLKLFFIFGLTLVVVILSFFATFNFSGYILLYTRICVLLVLFILITIINAGLIYFSKYTDTLKKGVTNSFWIGLKSKRILLSSLFFFGLLLSFLRVDILITFIYIFSFGGISLFSFFNYKYLVKEFKKYE